MRNERGSTVGMDLEARYSSGTRSFRLVLLSFPLCSSGQTSLIIRRESSKLSFSTLSEGTRGKEDRKIKFENEIENEVSKPWSFNKFIVM